jgi:IS4 transposase
MEIYKELREIEYMLWRLEMNLKREELRERILVIRYELIKTLLKMKGVLEDGR